MAEEMIELSFTLAGEAMPSAASLWAALARAMPGLAAHAQTGLLPLPHADGSPLSRRARLTLRIPVNLRDAVAQLSGVELAMEDGVLKLGEARARALQPHPTLHAHRVASDMGEEAFIAWVHAELRAMEVRCGIICGRHLAGDEGLPSGYSLVLHELNPEHSLRVQCMGMGGYRHLGCGVFVPYKAITKLD